MVAETSRRPRPRRVPGRNRRLVFGKLGLVVPASLVLVVLLLAAWPPASLAVQTFVPDAPCSGRGYLRDGGDCLCIQPFSGDRCEYGFSPPPCHPPLGVEATVSLLAGTWLPVEDTRDWLALFRVNGFDLSHTVVTIEAPNPGDPYSLGTFTIGEALGGSVIKTVVLRAAMADSVLYLIDNNDASSDYDVDEWGADMLQFYVEWATATSPTSEPCDSVTIRALTPGFDSGPCGEITMVRADYCPSACSYHGRCDLETRECECDDGWEGPVCARIVQDRMPPKLVAWSIGPSDDGDAISVSLRIEDSGSGLPLDFPAAIRCDHPDPLVFCGLPSFVRFYPEDELSRSSHGCESFDDVAERAAAYASLVGDLSGVTGTPLTSLFPSLDVSMPVAPELDLFGILPGIEPLSAIPSHPAAIHVLVTELMKDSEVTPLSTFVDPATNQTVASSLDIHLEVPIPEGAPGGRWVLSSLVLVDSRGNINDVAAATVFDSFGGVAAVAVDVGDLGGRELDPTWRVPDDAIESWCPHVPRLASLSFPGVVVVDPSEAGGSIVMPLEADYGYLPVRLNGTDPNGNALFETGDDTQGGSPFVFEAFFTSADTQSWFGCFGGTNSTAAAGTVTAQCNLNPAVGAGRWDLVFLQMIMPDGSTRLYQRESLRLVLADSASSFAVLIFEASDGDGGSGASPTPSPPSSEPDSAEDTSSPSLVAWRVAYTKCAWSSTTGITVNGDPLDASAEVDLGPDCVWSDLPVITPLDLSTGKDVAIKVTFDLFDFGSGPATDAPILVPYLDTQTGVVMQVACYPVHPGAPSTTSATTTTTSEPGGPTPSPGTPSGDATATVTFEGFIVITPASSSRSVRYLLNDFEIRDAAGNTAVVTAQSVLTFTRGLYPGNVSPQTFLATTIGCDRSGVEASPSISPIAAKAMDKMSGTIFATVERYPLLRDLSLTLDASALLSGGSVSSGSSSFSAHAVLSGTIGVRDPVFGIMVGNDADAAVRLPVDPEAGILACTEACMFGPSGLAPWVLRVGLRERGTTRTVAVDMVMTSLVSGSVVDGVVVVEGTLPVDVFRLADAGDPPAVWDVSFVTLASGAGRTVRGASNLAFYNLDAAVDLALVGWGPYSYSVLSPVLDADPPALTTYVLSQEGANARRFTLTLNVWDTSDNRAGGYLIFSSRTDGRLHQIMFGPDEASASTMLPVGQTRYLIGLDFGGETAAVDLWVSAVRLFDAAGNWVLYRPTPDPTDDDDDWEAVRWTGDAMAFPMVSIRLTLPVYAPPATPAPEVESARFSDDGASLVIAFDSETNRGDGADCSVLFSSATLAALGGPSAACLWSSDAVLVVVLAPTGATLTTSDLLTWSDYDVLLSRDRTSAAVHMPFSVDPPTVWPVPEAVAAGPLRVATCQGATFNALQSTGGFGRALDVVWSVEVETAGGGAWLAFDVDAASAAAVAAGLSPISSLDQAVVTFPPFVLPPGSYRLSATVVNFLGTASQPAVVGLTVDDTPELSVFLDGPAVRTVTTDTTLSITPVVDVGECAWNEIPLPDGGVDGYHWTLTVLSGDVVGPYDDIYRVFEVIPHMLTVGSYHLKVDLLGVDGTVLASSPPVTIVVVPTPLTVAIIGGNRRVSVSQPLVLQTAVYGVIAAADFAYGWTCTVVASNFLATGDPCSFGAGVQVDGASLTIEARGLLVGTYEVRLDVAHAVDGRTASAVIEVEFVYGSPLDVVLMLRRGGTTDPLAPATRCIALVNPSSRVVIGAAVLAAGEQPGDAVGPEADVVMSGRMRSLQVDWAMTRFDGTQVALTGAGSAVSTSQTAVDFAAGFLEPGTVYTLTVSLIDPLTAATGSSSIRIRTGGRPRGGVCSVVGDNDGSGGGGGQPSGTAFDTRFLITCSGWTDDEANFPLTYAFVVGGRPLTGSSLVPRAETMLPAASTGGDGTVLVEAVIRNALGVSIRVPMAVSVAPRGGSSDATAALVFDQLENADATKNLGLTSSLVLAFASSPLTNGASGPLTAVEERAIDALFSHLAAFRADSEWACAAPSLAAGLTTATGSDLLTPSARRALVVLLDSYDLATVVACLDNGTEGGDLATALLSLLADLTASLSHVFRGAAVDDGDGDRDGDVPAASDNADDQWSVIETERRFPAIVNLIRCSAVLSIEVGDAPLALESTHATIVIAKLRNRQLYGSSVSAANPGSPLDATAAPWVELPSRSSALWGLVRQEDPDHWAGDVDEAVAVVELAFFAAAPWDWVSDQMVVSDTVMVSIYAGIAGAIPVGVTGLPETDPVGVYIPHGRGAARTGAATVEAGLTDCRYWNETSRRWEAAGVVRSGETAWNATYSRCDATHLTDFALVNPPASESEVMVAADPSVLLFLTLGVVVAVYLVYLYFLMRAGSRREAALVDLSKSRSQVIPELIVPVSSKVNGKGKLRRGGGGKTMEASVGAIELEGSFSAAPHSPRAPRVPRSPRSNGTNLTPEDRLRIVRADLVYDTLFHGSRRGVVKYTARSRCLWLALCACAPHDAYELLWRVTLLFSRVFTMIGVSAFAISDAVMDEGVSAGNLVVWGSMVAVFTWPLFVLLGAVFRVSGRLDLVRVATSKSRGSIASQGLSPLSAALMQTAWGGRDSKASGATSPRRTNRRRMSSPSNGTSTSTPHSTSSSSSSTSSSSSSPTAGPASPRRRGNGAGPNLESAPYRSWRVPRWVAAIPFAVSIVVAITSAVATVGMGVGATSEQTLAWLLAATAGCLVDLFVLQPASVLVGAMAASWCGKAGGCLTTGLCIRRTGFRPTARVGAAWEAGV